VIFCFAFAVIFDITASMILAGKIFAAAVIKMNGVRLVARHLPALIISIPVK
jgi:hypothetical protein